MPRLLLLSLLFIALPARAADLVLAGRIDRVVVAGDLIGVVREGEVRVLSADGRVLLRLPPEADVDVGARRAGRADDVLEENGIADADRDSAYAEELIDDELTLRDRRGAPTSEPDEPRPTVLAGGPSGLWIAAGRTLWRVEDGRLRRVSTLAQRFDHLAAGPDGRLLAATGPHLWLSRDEGLTFDRLADADGPVRGVAAGDGFLGWTTGGRLTRVEVGRVVTRPVAAPSGLCACGPALLALEERGLLVVEAEARSLPVGRDVHRLGCAGGTWVLVGRRLLVSRDEGRTFLPSADLPPALPLDAAVGAGGLWVGTEAGLYRLGAGGPRARPMPGPVLIPPAPRWARYLPRITVAASAVHTAGRDDLQAVTYADFPLSAPPRPALPVRRLAQLVSEPAPAPLPLPADREASCLTVARNEAVARALVEPERARSYVSRAGHAAWLPELRVLMNRRLGRSESLDVPSGGSVGTGPLGLDTANDVRYEARATWDLSKLVFSTEEIAAVTAALRMADLRREVESLANRLYFERRRLKMEPVQSPTTDPRARRELRVEELEAELDAMSGGAFTRCLPAPP
jgi:hypothetical protein